MNDNLPPSLSRRAALLGLATIAAPFVIRTPGLLMPVKNRIMPPFYNEWGDRNWKDYPATLDEYLAYERSRIAMANSRIMVSFSAEGANRIAAMIDARKRFEAMGLLSAST
jgi:hypothetical protein